MTFEDLEVRRRAGHSSTRSRSSPSSPTSDRLRAALVMSSVQPITATGAAALPDSLPATEWLIADRGYDADWFGEALRDKGIRPCIPGRKSRGRAVRYDKRRYKRRDRIEIMFGGLKDWRRIATRHDRCPKVFLPAIALAATVIFWI